MEQTNKSILDTLSVFLYRKWLFITPIVAGTIIGLIVALTLPAKYSSTTLILAEEQQVPEEYVTPSDKTPFSQRLNVISQQILSRTRLEKIIKEFNLYGGGAGGFFSKLSIFSFNSAEQPADDWVIERMRSDIDFMVLGDTNSRKGQHDGGNAFTITYKGADPKTAMQVTNTIASLFIEENLKAREQFAEGTSEFIINELDKSKTELEELERSLKSFKETHMGALPEQLDANLRTLDRLQLELQNVSASIKHNEDRKSLLEEQMSIVVPGRKPMMNSPLLNELQRLRNELAVLKSMYKDNYPDVLIAKKRISDLESQIANGAGTEKEPESLANTGNPEIYAELSGVKSQISTLRQRESQIRRQIADYERRVELTPTNEQRQSDLMRDYRISLQNYQSLLEKKMNARLSENLEKNQKGARFRVIDPANLPQEPNSPNKLAVTLYGMGGGGALGVGLVLLFEFLNPAFRKPEDFDGVVASPVLSSIPVFPFGKDNEPKLKVIKGRKDIA